MPGLSEPLPNPVLSDTVLDREAAARLPRGFVPSLLADPATKVLEIRGDRARVHMFSEGAELEFRAPTDADRRWYEAHGVVLYVGRLGEQRALAVLRPAQEEPPEGWVTLRDAGLRLPPESLAVCLTAVALANWHARHPRCPMCGGRTLPRQAGWVRVCEDDGSQHFPRTDPAVIMSVVDADERLLLARGPRWKGPHRSVLAGFVEPGESFEAAVVRETFEESGVVVEDVRYLGNQPWPFPASLMVGFVARATTSELTPEEGEIEEIGWYTREDVERGLAEGTLRLPGRLSIARSLIEHWYGGELPDPKDVT